jgi:hypothetical protein
MATLYYEKSKRMLRLVKQTTQARDGIQILLTGDVTVRANMAGGKYYIDIGDFKEAIVAQPIVVGDRVAFMVTTHSLSRLGLDVYTVEIANHITTLRNSIFLHNLIWDFVGMEKGSTQVLSNIVGVRLIPPLTAGRDPLRVCEGYLSNTKTFFFVTPSTRSLAVVVRYQFVRDREGRLTAVIPEKPHAA